MSIPQTTERVFDHLQFESIETVKLIRDIRTWQSLDFVRPYEQETPRQLLVKRLDNLEHACQALKNELDSQ